MKIVLGESVRGAKAELDLQELITGRTLLCCISRFGKTWTARRIVEQIFGKTGIVIVDVEGEYATLRDKFPFLIIGKDVPLVPESAEFLADQVLEHDLSVIIDGSDPQLDVAAFQEFIARFIERFIAIETKARKPYLWILEEADELAPETGVGRSVCLQQIRKLVKKGGKRGIGCLTLTQRPAFVSKFVISQCSGKIIGRTEWPDDLAVLRKFGRVPLKLADPESKDPHALKNLEKGQFYVSGDFIEKDELVKVGPVITTHSGATPEIVPPAPRELKDVVAQLSEKLPGIIQEQLVPAIPKQAEMEARLKEKLEGQWQARLARKDKELASIRSRTEAKYEVQMADLKRKHESEIADLKRKLDEAVRHATLKGGVSDLLSHPLIQKSVKGKLNEKQWGFLELLETKGPQDPEHCSLFLEVKPNSVPNFVHEVNRKIPGLVENQNGRYASRLAKLFPVTEEAQAEVKESEKLRAEIDALKQTLTNREHELANARTAARFDEDRANKLADDVKRLEGLVKDLTKNQPEKEFTREEIPKKYPTSETSDSSVSAGNGPTIPVEATLHRTLTKFNMATNTEVLDADESAPIGRILARGLAGFFDQPRTFGMIMSEMERKYSISVTSGGNRKSAQSALDELVGKDILDRKSEGNQWTYFATQHFKEPVRPLQVA